MDVHFEAVDPLERLIICTKHQWYDHILNRRLWVDDAKWEDEIVKALSGPIFICPDNHYEDRECFYFRPGPNAFYLKVVVRFDKTNSGSVITAYEVNEPEEELIKWTPLLKKS